MGDGFTDPVCDKLGQVPPKATWDKKPRLGEWSLCQDFRFDIAKAAVPAHRLSRVPPHTFLFRCERMH